MKKKNQLQTMPAAVGTTGMLLVQRDVCPKDISRTYE